MEITFSKQLWIVFKIWFFAVVANTLLGTVYMTDFFTSGSDLFVFLIIGAYCGAMYSIPVLIVLLIVINICIGWNVKGIWIFRIVFLFGIVLTTGMFLVFAGLIGGLSAEMYVLLTIALLSAIIGIASQCKSLFMLGSDFSQSNNYKP